MGWWVVSGAGWNAKYLFVYLLNMEHKNSADKENQIGPRSSGFKKNLIKRHTGYFRKVYRSLQVWVPRKILIYLSIQKLPRKRSHQFYLSIEFIKKYSYCVLLTNINSKKIKILSSTFYKYHLECT